MTNGKTFLLNALLRGVSLTWNEAYKTDADSDRNIIQYWQLLLS